MKILKDMKIVKSSAGLTTVNPKFSFSNSAVLSSQADANKSSPVISRNVTKIVDPFVDSKRFADLTSRIVPSNPTPTKTFSPLSPSLEPRVPVVTPANSRSPLTPISGNVVQPTTSPALNQPTTSPALNQPTTLTVQTQISPAERSIFGSGSFLGMTGLNLDESYTGQPMNKDSKCKILAIIAEDIVDGYPKSNVLIFKKSESESVQPKLYTILRKNLFSDREYSKLIEIKPEDTSFPDEYSYLLEDFEISEKNVFAVKDASLKANTTYIYKIRVSWSSKVSPPSNPTTGSNLVSSLPAIVSNIARTSQN
jgi:hypothetical protein